MSAHAYTPLVQPIHLPASAAYSTAGVASLQAAQDSVNQSHQTTLRAKRPGRWVRQNRSWIPESQLPLQSLPGLP